MFHGWMFDPDGDHAAADSTRSSTTLDTGLSVNPRTARRLVTASYTSTIAYLPAANRVDANPPHDTSGCCKLTHTRGLQLRHSWRSSCSSSCSRHRAFEWTGDSTTSTIARGYVHGPDVISALLGARYRLGGVECQRDA